MTDKKLINMSTADGYIADARYWTRYECKDPRHLPPSHLSIPNGAFHRHVCPTCGVETMLGGSNIRMGK